MQQTNTTTKKKPTPPLTKRRTRVVYLLQFSERIHHAGHYLGSAKRLDERLAEHAQGYGARLTQVIREKGISFELAQTWAGGRKEERLLKNR